MCALYSNFLFLYLCVLLLFLFPNLTDLFWGYGCWHPGFLPPCFAGAPLSKKRRRLFGSQSCLWHFAGGGPCLAPVTLANAFHPPASSRLVSRRPTLKNRVWGISIQKVWCHRNVGGTNQISPRQINDVTLVIDIVLVTIIAYQIIFSL